MNGVRAIESGDGITMRMEEDKMRFLPDSASRLWVHLVRIYNQVLRETRSFFRRYGLTPTQFDVITCLGSQEGITQQELSEHLSVTKGNITSLIDRMERDGLVERRADPSDRRCYRLFLTRKGRRLLQRIIPAHEKQIARLFSSLSAEERALLQNLLRRLEQSLARNEA